ILYVCYDNEAYMNTGIQRSSATPFGAWTTTTPDLKHEYKKDIMQILAAHRIPYAATASIAYPDDLFEKTVKAKSLSGLKFLHVFAPCPTGWQAPSELSVQLARLVVLTRIFPLYEIEGGSDYTVENVDKPLPVSAYTKLQGRFKNLDENSLLMIQEHVDERWAHLTAMASLSQ
ncbi:MAG: thiamine pyrophosphate-dependent enzyme, partial [bacterium]